MTFNDEQNPFAGLCPVCGGDEGLLSEDNETFLCAHCGHYTTEYSEQSARYYRQKFSSISAKSILLKPTTLNCSVH